MFCWPMPLWSYIKVDIFNSDFFESEYFDIGSFSTRPQIYHRQFQQCIFTSAKFSISLNQITFCAHTRKEKNRSSSTKSQTIKIRLGNVIWGNELLLSHICHFIWENRKMFAVNDLCENQAETTSAVNKKTFTPNCFRLPPPIYG